MEDQIDTPKCGFTHQYAWRTMQRDLILKFHVLPSSQLVLEIFSLMAREHKGAAPKLSLRKRRREAATIRKRSRLGNNALRKHKREA